MRSQKRVGFYVRRFRPSTTHLQHALPVPSEVERRESGIPARYGPPTVGNVLQQAESLRLVSYYRSGRIARGHSQYLRW